MFEALKFLARLARDRRGNTMMLFAFALFPLMGMTGGALDMSRSYLVKTRLQHACDAAVLAGRRSMSGSQFDQTARDAANEYFATNFNTGRYGARNVAIQYQVGNDMIVHGTASADLPMTLMRIFAVPQMRIEVGCDAQLQLPNTDIMFVLDTTLSMAETNAGDSKSRIQVLRESVGSFYTTMEAARRGNTQIRYGFVPYASTVNVGLLLKRDWMVDNWTYQSREKDIVEPITGGPQGAETTTTTAWVTISGDFQDIISYLPSENCVGPANTSKTVTDNPGWTSTTQPNGDVWKTRTRTQTITGSTYSVSLTNGLCKLTERKYNSLKQTREETTKPNPNAGQTTTSDRYWWNYKPVTYDVRALKGTRADGLMAGGTFVAAIANNHANRTLTWNAASACIEERSTARPLSFDREYDMDVDLVPTTDPNTQWRPAIPGLVYARSVTNYTSPSGWDVNTVRHYNNFINLSSYPNDRAACPTASKKLNPMTQTEVTNYLNTLKTAGLTYHDVGFLWGLRLMSAQGLFASENSTAPNGGTIARHLIFMTDGATETNISDYDAYGLAALDRRRTLSLLLPTAAQHNTIVEDRLLRLCTVAKQQKGITVWVIAFGTSLTPLLTSCASPDRAYQANNAVDLNNTFAEIAARISQLRLSR